jgi:N-hydroxyarylamine O-acetyltransferase
LELSAYLHRIRFDGSVRPDLATLRAIHRAHQYAIPFENLDVLLRRPVVLDLEANYDKIVCRRRGGWCYEMNGVMGWALKEIGFEVMRMSAGVMRVQAGDAQLGNHLCLLVRLDQPYLVDVGFGGSLAEPLPLVASEREDRPYHLGLSELGDSYWRFAEIAHGDDDVFSFDFRAVPADEALLAGSASSFKRIRLPRSSRILSCSAAQPTRTFPCAAAFWRLFMRRVSTRSC